MTAASDYLAKAVSLLQIAARRESATLKAAAAAASEAVAGGGLIYIFGTGHSHMMAEEGHFRAGGLACVVPVLSSAVMLHEGAMASTQLERLTGLADIVLGRYPIGPADVLIVFSTSGVNAAPVEAARFGRARGAKVIAVTSVAYSTAAANGRERLADLGDFVLDTGAPPGDAVSTIRDGVTAGPVSTVLGAALLNALLVAVASDLERQGHPAPVYLSANMPGAAENNAKLTEIYKARNPHL
ncbi:MAG TPA: sugar isomerase domain-containing protein [Kaistia sp.]|nr:sugar isomerase domain-containing protein [Kaistia sp.]